MQLPISFLGCRVGLSTKAPFWLYVLQVIGHLSPRLVALDEVGVEEDDDSLSFQTKAATTRPQTRLPSSPVTRGQGPICHNLATTTYRRPWIPCLLHDLMFLLLSGDLMRRMSLLVAVLTSPSTRGFNRQSRIMKLLLSPRPPAESLHSPVVSPLV